MARQLTDKARAFRALVIELDGDQPAIGERLGISASAVSHRLQSELHGAWWRAFKRKRSKRRKAAQQRRWRARRAARYGGTQE